MAGPVPRTAGMIASSRAFTVRLAASVLLINLFVICLTGFSLYRSRQQYESRVAIQTQNLAQSLSLAMASIMDKANMAIFAAAKEMERQIRQGGVDGRSMHGYILQQLERLPELDGLRIANARGQVIYGDRVAPGAPVNIADREWFIKARNNPEPGVTVTKPLFGRHSKHWVFNIIRRIDNPDGSFAGIAYASISLDYLSRLFSSFDLGNHGVITLRDHELTVVVRYPEPRSIGSQTVSRELRALIRTGQPSGIYTTRGCIDTTERIFSYHKVAGYPLYINVGRATSDYLTPWRSDVRGMLLLAAIFTAGSLAAARLIYRNRKRMELAEAGLLRNHEALEETVRERTSQLEAKNVQLAREITLRKQVDADLQKAAIVMDRMADAVEWVSRDGRYLYVNDAACRMHGYNREELLSMSVSQIAPQFPPEVWHTHWQELKRVGHLHFETVNRSRDGREFPAEVSANYLDIDGVEYNCAIIRDISDRTAAETEKQHLVARLHQSQKIESIGRLAGGIAHDFNNLLTPILVYAELVKNRLTPGSRDFDRLASIIQAADKARVLTQQLLSFGRQQVLEIKTVDLNGVICAFHDILRRTIRENITIQMHLSEVAYGIRADSNQLEQIIMNLAINAQDAIAGNGVITIETAPVILDDEYARSHAGVAAGAYLMLAVADSGSGMDQETQVHIFEPFFTTKEVGKGSGLGLATVYGLVGQQGGHIGVESEIGQGTVFKIYFPIADGMPAVETAAEPEIRKVDAGNRTILLVEDNDMVRDLVCDLLDDCGCRLLVAHGARQALRLSKGEPVDLLLTDVVMPDMNGPELHRRLLETHGDLKVLYMSGYTDNAALPPGVLDEGSNFIRKPFNLKDLARMIDAILNLPEKP